MREVEHALSALGLCLPSGLNRSQVVREKKRQKSQIQRLNGQLQQQDGDERRQIQAANEW